MFVTVRRKEFFLLTTGVFHFCGRKVSKSWKVTFVTYFAETSGRCCTGDISGASGSTGVHSVIEWSLVQSEENIGRNLGRQDEIQVSLPVALSPCYRFYRPNQS